MEGILLLLIVFSIWQFIEHRKNRKQSDVNWAEVAQCEAELADAHPEKIIVLPTMDERIDSCYQTLEECQEEWLRSEAEFHAMLGEEDEASPFELFCQGCFVSSFKQKGLQYSESLDFTVFQPSSNNIKTKSRSANTRALLLFISLRTVVSHAPLLQSSGHTRSSRIRFEARWRRMLSGQNRILQANHASTAAGDAYRDNAA